MCTGILYRNGSQALFGRNLDLQYQLGNELTVCPRNYVLPFRHIKEITNHSAIFGMAIARYGYPLYFEGVNESGLGVASLNFPAYGKYSQEPEEGKTNITSFELIPYLLCTCKSVEEAKRELANMCIVADSFNAQIVSVPLHWIAADKNGSIVIEQTESGLHVYDNPLNVLANAPDYPAQAVNFANYIALSPAAPENRAAAHVDIPLYSSGMGSDGLPGGLDSMSRFCRVAFMLNNSKAEENQTSTVSQFFHILNCVAQIRGANLEKDGFYEITNYSAGADLETMDYFWTTYDCPQIQALHTKALDLDGSELICFPAESGEPIHWKN